MSTTHTTWVTPLNFVQKNAVFHVKIKTTTPSNRTTVALLRGGAGKFEGEIVPVEVPQRRGDAIALFQKTKNTKM